MTRAQTRADLGFAVAVLVICAFTWREADRLQPALFDPLGPKSFPIWICAILAGLAVLMLVRMALGKAIGASRTSLITGLGDDPDATHAARPGLAVATFAITAAYAAALSVPGLKFVVATAAYIAAMILALGPRRPRDLVLAGVVAAGGGLAVDLLFRVVFAVDLQ